MKRKSNEAISKKEIRSLIKAAESLGPVKGLATILALAAGMRVNEICQSEFSWFDFESQVIKLPRSAAKYKHGRIIPLSEILIKWVKIAMVVNSGSKYLFPGRSKHLSKRTIQRWIDEAFLIAGIESTPHSLRHTFATHLYFEGKLDVFTISSVLGHKSPNTTSIYIDGILPFVKSILDKIF